MLDENLRLFVDLDGTLAEFKTVDTLETLYEEGYFRNLKPQQSVVDAVNFILEGNSNIDVYILSSVLTDSKYALNEKNAWIDEFLPGIPPERRIFPPCGADKKDYIEGGVGPTDFLLDDYSVNLNSWEPPARGIKLMNGINGTKGTWQSDKLAMDKPAEELAINIVNIMSGREHYRDEGPIFYKEQDFEKAKEVERQALNFFQTILEQAQRYISHSGDPQGVWSGRVVNNEHPEEYLDISVEGIRRTNEICVTVEPMCGEPRDIRQVILNTDCSPKDIKKAIQIAYAELEGFICESLTLFHMEEKEGLGLYAPFADKSVEDHINMIKDPSTESNELSHRKAGR